MCLEIILMNALNTSLLLAIFLAFLTSLINIIMSTVFEKRKTNYLKGVLLLTAFIAIAYILSILIILKATNNLYLLW